MTVFLAVCANETTHKTHLPNAQKVRRNIPNRDKAYFDMLLASGSSMTTWSRRSRRLSVKKARSIAARTANFVVAGLHNLVHARVVKDLAARRTLNPPRYLLAHCKSH